MLGTIFTPFIIKYLMFLCSLFYKLVYNPIVISILVISFIIFIANNKIYDTYKPKQACILLYKSNNNIQSITFHDEASKQPFGRHHNITKEELLGLAAEQKNTEIAAELINMGVEYTGENQEIVNFIKKIKENSCNKGNRATWCYNEYNRCLLYQRGGTSQWQWRLWTTIDS